MGTKTACASLAVSSSLHHMSLFVSEVTELTDETHTADATY